MKERIYIFYRRLKALTSKICFMICSFFPINESRICVSTFEGKGGFGCNPKYIVEELHRRNPNYEFIWFVDDMEKVFPSYIKKVSNTLWSRAYWLSTSKVWIDNYRKPYGTRKRKGQCYINTWHGTIGFKSIGLWRGKAFSKMAYIVSKNDSDMIDRVVIDSEWGAEMYPNGLIYTGKFLWAGSPRCDILFNNRNSYKEKFHKEKDLPQNAKLVMFAPTFREGIKDGKRSIFSEEWSLDFDRLLKNLEKRFGGVWYLCLRLHPQLAAKMEISPNRSLGERIIDVSKVDDMYELLAAMDVFITDYSSAAMDAGFVHLPVFLYADDIEEYIQDRGSMCWDLSSDSKTLVRNSKTVLPNIDVVLPFSIAQNNDELEANILSFCEMNYLSKMKAFEKGVKLIFDGKASERVADWIEGRENNVDGSE